MARTRILSQKGNMSSPAMRVAEALVIGTQQWQATVLIELFNEKEGLTPTERAEHIEKLWPTIVEANRDAPSHARITKSHIFFISPQKPMIRAGKGTVQRAVTLTTYIVLRGDRSPIAEQSSADDDAGIVIPSETADESTRLRYVNEAFLSVTGWGEVDDSQDLCGSGMDTLYAILLVRTLKRTQYSPEIAPNTLYTNASPIGLTRATFPMQDDHSQSHDAQEQARLSRRDELIHEYTRKIYQ
ncbi:MAG: hypothetical protein Q9204_003631, partial [Flavoplaca sp. TL-2023a]